MGAGSLLSKTPIFHCAVCQIQMFILLSGGKKKINLCYKTVITKSVCDFCCPLVWPVDV